MQAISAVRQFGGRERSQVTGYSYTFYLFKHTPRSRESKQAWNFNSNLNKHFDTIAKLQTSDRRTALVDHGLPRAHVWIAYQTVVILNVYITPISVGLECLGIFCRSGATNVGTGGLKPFHNLCQDSNFFIIYAKHM